MSLPEPEPWPEPVDGAELLDAIFDEHSPARCNVGTRGRNRRALGRSHLLASLFGISPRLAITSPEKGCGKTTVLDVCRVLSAGRYRPRTQVRRRSSELSN